MTTNGTLGCPLRVQLDEPSWYDVNYGTYGAVAHQIDGLMERMVPAESCLFFISDDVYQPKLSDSVYSVFIPTLKYARLHHLLIGRSEDVDLRTVRLLRAAPVALLYGKPSVLRRLADLDAAYSVPGRIRAFAVLVSGEALYEDERVALEEWFGGRVSNAYLATEAGLIALECAHRTGLHVRPHTLKVEVLSAGGEISQEGRGDLLITNLFFRAHVFVRYRLGDEVEIENRACACGFTGQTIVALHGRETRTVRVGFETVPASSFTERLLSLPIRSFQVVQSASGSAMIKWAPASRRANTINEVSSRIDRWLSERGWSESVESVPLTQITPPCGKQRRFPLPEQPSTHFGLATGARTQHFVMEDGSFTTSCGRFRVAGQVRDKWYQLGALHGVLGAPAGDADPTADGLGLIQWFLGPGAIVMHPSSGGPFAVHGAIYERWKRGGFETGIGLPECDPLSCGTGSGRFMQFGRSSEFCRVYWTGSLGAVLIAPPFLEPWLDAGAEIGALGYPVKEAERDVSSGTAVMIFEEGVMRASEEGIAISITGSSRDPFGSSGPPQ